MALNYSNFENKAQPQKMGYKQAISMQSTINNALINRAPQNPTAQPIQTVTNNGFGRSY